jgi:ABC-type antimicrobial peptide transport system permease subunit
MLNVSAAEVKTSKIKRQSEFNVVALRLSKNSSAIIGFVLALVLVLMTIFAPLIAPYPYIQQDLSHICTAPSAQHIRCYHPGSGVGDDQQAEEGF